MKTPPPLPLNFPQSFQPDRRLIARLLTFTAHGGRGDKRAISIATTIPTGSSTGKVEPMIYYGQAMGLLQASREGGEWQLALTPLGAQIWAEDPYLSEPQTQWLLHLMLCRRSGLTEPAAGVADPWFALVVAGRYRLGQPFSLEASYRYLLERYGARSYLKGLTSLLLRLYLEPHALGEIGLLTDEAGDLSAVQWSPAPLLRSYFPFYALFFYHYWDELFAEEQQIDQQEWAEQSGFWTLLGWDEREQTTWLAWMADEGYLQLDRQTGSALLLRLQSTAHLIPRLYRELL